MIERICLWVILLSSSNWKYETFLLLAKVVFGCLRWLCHHILIYTIPFSSLCRLTWKHCTYEVLLSHILLSVGLRWRWVGLSFIPIAIYEALCFQLTHFSFDEWKNMCTLSYYHHHNGSVNPMQRLTVGSWNNLLGCMSCYVLIWNIDTGIKGLGFETVWVKDTVWLFCFCYCLQWLLLFLTGLPRDFLRFSSDTNFL